MIEVGSFLPKQSWCSSRDPFRHKLRNHGPGAAIFRTSEILLMFGMSFNFNHSVALEFPYLK